MVEAEEDVVSSVAVGEPLVGVLAAERVKAGMLDSQVRVSERRQCRSKSTDQVGGIRVAQPQQSTRQREQRAVRTAASEMSTRSSTRDSSSAGIVLEDRTLYEYNRHGVVHSVQEEEAVVSVS